MKFELEIDCGNAAFGDNDEDARGHEVARILRDLAGKLEAGYIKCQLLDHNGNAVGVAQFSEAE